MFLQNKKNPILTVFVLGLMLSLQSCGDAVLLGSPDISTPPDSRSSVRWSPDTPEQMQQDSNGQGEVILSPSPDIDKDKDGAPAPMDCDDQNPNVYPNAQEQCNDIDDDCDDTTDEEAGLLWFEDADSDGFGNDETGVLLCDPPEKLVLEGGDCDDADPTKNPSATEQIDGIDSNCNGKKDWYLTIYTATDDAGELCINDAEEIIGETGGWVSGATHNVWMESGTHAVGIKGWDKGKQITATILHMETSQGMVVVTDGDWKYDPNPTADEGSRAGWCSPNFDDSNWDNALDIGPIGDPSNPWGNHPSAFPEGSPAHWIWDHFPVELNTQYLRRIFTLP